MSGSPAGSGLAANGLRSEARDFEAIQKFAVSEKMLVTSERRRYFANSVWVMEMH
ncbi:MAG: hypothetical protein DDT26_01882 [Dehalococcoidia bacterium]|nr:hypothetical protein [Chloroflexota bacterium]